MRDRQTLYRPYHLTAGLGAAKGRGNLEEEEERQHRWCWSGWGSGLHGRVFKIIFSKSSELCRLCPVGKRRWFTAGAKVETQIWLRWRGQTDKKEREMCENSTSCVKRDQKRGLVRTKIEKRTPLNRRVLPYSSPLLECSLACNIRSWTFLPCFALPFSLFSARLQEYKDLPIAKLCVLPQTRIPMKTWPKGIEESCGAY